MASRKLNLKQLVTLSEVYWDDAVKLKEILEALQARLEPEAEALQGMVERRLETLKHNPADKTPPPAEIASSSPEAPPPAEIDSGRRKWPAVVILALLLAAILTWMFWPVDKVTQTAAETEQGPEIQDLNEPPADDKPLAKSLPAPPPTVPRRVTIEPSPADREPPPSAREVEGRQRSRAQTAARSPEVKDPREATVRQNEASDVPAAADGGRARSEDVASAAAASSSRAAAARAPAARGVVTPEAQLDCYLTDNRPGSCGAAPSSGGGAGSGRSRPGAAGDVSSNPLPPPPAAGSRASPPPAETQAAGGGAPAARVSAASEQIAAKAAASASSSNRSSGAASSGSGADESAGGSAASPSRRAPGAAASAAETKDKSDPPASGESPPSSQAPGEMPPPPDCPAAPETDRVVFILDGSVSMALPLDVDGALEDELDARILRKDQAARQQYRALIAQPGPKRITRAQDAFASAANDLPPAVELGLMVFQECRDIRQIGIFEAARRGVAIAYVRNLIPRGRTPLADSLRRAGGMLGDGRSSIVMLTDGREFCGGDPCAAAAEIKAAHPDTPIHVVDITGQAKAECIADLTGGKSYKPEATDDLARILRNAFRGADPSCGIPSPEAAAP